VEGTDAAHHHGSPAVIADVWTKRDFVSVGFMLAAAALIGLGLLADVSALMIAGVLVGTIGLVVRVVWRILRGPNWPPGSDRWV
jgi:uncharacterized membrane protein YdfJ with MMPL/SSD domain